MAKHGKCVYPPGSRDTDIGDHLYELWRSMRKRKYNSPEFDDYANFYEWAIASGYSLGCWLIRNDKSKPYSPYNCFFRIPKQKPPEKKPKVQDGDLLRGMGNPLYTRFARMLKQPHAPEFDDFEFFVAWSKKNGYGEHTKLVLLNAEKPYSPDNCKWAPMLFASGMTMAEELDFGRRWTKTVNRIRKYYGMEPFPMPQIEKEDKR